MKVLRAPVQLKLSVYLLSLCIPLAVFHAVLGSKAPWWRIERNLLYTYAGVATILVVVLGGLILRGQRWALNTTGVIFGLWCVVVAGTALLNRNFSLGFFGIFLAAILCGIYYWLQTETSRSYFDPAVAWYQGAPKPVPGVDCEIPLMSGRKVKFRVGRIDEQGASLFSERDVDLVLSSDVVEATFLHRGRHVACLGQWIWSDSDQKALGFRFMGMTPDAQKDLGDFVEILRGDGHV